MCQVHFRTYWNGPVHDYMEYGFDVAASTDDVKIGEWTDWVKEKYDLEDTAEPVEDGGISMS